MDRQAIAWPVKTREIHDAIFDSRVWNDFQFRDDDIVIASWGKSGTTWVQQIVAQLLFDGAENMPVAKISPWLDYVLPPLETMQQELRTQTHRRFMKTHLPLDALVFSQKAKYIYVGRDGRDLVWSMYNHHARFVPEFYTAFADNPRRGPDPSHRDHFGPPDGDVVAYFREWLAKDGYPWWPFWENVRGWWNVRGLPNVHLVHFANLKRDLSSEMQRIAHFLEIPIDETRWPMLVEHCTFDYMKAHAEELTPLGGAIWEGGAQTFMHRGENGRWRDALDAEDIRGYEARVLLEVGADGARWLATGELPS
jgi:aryl sulfotransferase